MARFNCVHCSYSFEKDEMPKRCPYCGRAEGLEEEENAEELVSHIE